MGYRATAIEREGGGERRDLAGFTSQNASKLRLTVMRPAERCSRKQKAARTQGTPVARNNADVIPVHEPICTERRRSHALRAGVCTFPPPRKNFHPVTLSQIATQPPYMCSTFSQASELRDLDVRAGGRAPRVTVPSQVVLCLAVTIISLTLVDCQTPARSAAGPALGRTHVRSGHSVSMPTWWLPFPQHGSVEGGSTLSVAGSLFEVGKQYTLHFYSPLGLHDTATTVASAPHGLGFLVPPYGRQAATITLALRNHLGDELQVAAGNETIFEYLAAISSFNGSSSSAWFPPTEMEPSRGAFGIERQGQCQSVLGTLNSSFACDAPFSGGPSITVRGSGFQIGTCGLCLDIKDCLAAGCTSVDYVLVLRDAQNLSLHTSTTARAVDLTTIIFTLPAWPHAHTRGGVVNISTAGATVDPAASTSSAESNSSVSILGVLVSMTVLRGSTELHQRAPAYLTYRPEFSSVSPVEVEEWDTLHVHGSGFAVDQDYLCAFSRPNASGYTWLAEERGFIQGTVVNSTLLLCPWRNVSVLDPQGAPSYDFSLFRAADQLKRNLPQDQAFAVSMSARSRSRGWGAFYPHSHSSSDTSRNLHVSVLVSVDKAYVGQLRAENFVTMHRKRFAPLLQRFGQTSFLNIRHKVENGMWLGANVTSAPAVGGTPIQLEVYGLETGEEAQRNRSLVAVGVRDSLSSLLAIVTHEDPPVFPGLMFDLFAKRQTNFEGLVLATNSPGVQTAWLYWRNGSFEHHDLGSLAEHGWKLLNDGGSVINGSNRYDGTVRLAQPVRFEAGATYGLLVILSHKVLYSDTGRSLNATDDECCATYQQSSRACCKDSTEYSDGFLAIHPAQVILAQGSMQDPSAPTSLTNTEDIMQVPQAPVFFSGAVLYGYDGYGPDYQCRFELKSSLGSHEAQAISYKTKAKPLGASMLSVSSTLECVVPSWTASADFRAKCRGSPSFDGLCRDHELGFPCGGHCQHGAFIPEQGSCSGTCMCNFLGIAGRPVCSGGSGSCSCRTPNTNASCYNNTACTGHGSCVDIGQCQLEMDYLIFSLEKITDRLDSSGRFVNTTVPYAVSSTAASSTAKIQLYTVWTSMQMPVSNLWVATFNSSKSYQILSPSDGGNLTITCAAINCSCSDHGASSTISPWDIDCGCACSPRTNARTTSALARGGQLIWIEGNGFDASYDGYQCQFSAGNSSLITNAYVEDGSLVVPEHLLQTNATVFNSSAISCVFPQWNFTASESGLHLTSESIQLRLIGRAGRTVHYSPPDCGRLLPYPYTSCLPPIISVREHWYGVGASEIAVASGESLRIFGNGFDVGSQAYTCWLRGKLKGMNATVRAQVWTHDLILCEIPAEGAEDTRIYVELKHYGVTVEHTDNGMQTWFSLRSSWSAHSPTSGGAEGGTVIRFNVYGVSNELDSDSTTYTCIFRTDDWVMTSNASILQNQTSTTPARCPNNGSIACRFECTSPPFVGRYGIAANADLQLDGVSAKLSLVKMLGCSKVNSTTAAKYCNSTTMTHIGKSDSFFFFSTLSAIYPAVARANGGEEIVLSAHALVSAGAHYSCSFTRLDTHEWAKPAQAVNNSVTCTTPVWGKSLEAATTNVSLWRVVNCSEVLPGWASHRIAYQDACAAFEVPLARSLGAAIELQFLAVWAEVTPLVLRGEQHQVQILSVKGWGFSSNTSLRCKFHTANTAREINESDTTVISPRELLCPFSAAWLGDTEAWVNLTLNSSGGTLDFVGNFSTFFVLYNACTEPIHALLWKSSSLGPCSEGQCSIPLYRIPQNESANITFLGAQASPYSYVALARNSSCKPEYFVDLYPLALLKGVIFENSLNFTGPLSVCYSTSGKEGPYCAQPYAEIISESSAVSSSISAVVSGQLGGQQQGRIVFVGAGFSHFNFVALHLDTVLSRRLLSSVTCTWNESLSGGPQIVALNQGTGMQAESVTVTLAVGSYRLCYSTSGPHSTAAWILQDLPNLVVLNASQVITAFSPSSAAPGMDFNATFVGAVPSLFTAVAFAPQGQCMNKTARHTASLQHSLLGGFHIVGSGEYRVCHSASGLAGTYVEQAGLVLYVIPPAREDSILSILPANVVAGHPITIDFQGFHVSAWSFVALASHADCRGESVLWVSPYHAKGSVFEVILPLPDEYTVCYTTSSQRQEFIAQKPRLRIIPQASARSILRVTPTRVAPFVQTDFTFESTAPGGADLVSMTSFVALARPGQCPNVSVSGGVQNITHQNTATSLVSGEGDWVVCYSTSGANGPYVEQGLQGDPLSPRVFGIRPANVSRISHMVPNRISVGFETDVEFSGATFSERHSFVAFSLPGNCSQPVHIFQLKARTVAVRISSSNLTELCYSTSGSNGPFLPQSAVFGPLVYYVENPGVVLQVVPSRIAAGAPKSDIIGEILGSASPRWKPEQHTNLLKFVGADWSQDVYVALTRTGQCVDRDYTQALASGEGSQADALRLSIRYPGLYHVCYSVTGDTNSSVWVLQQAQVIVVPAAVTGMVTALKVCAYDPVALQEFCTEGTRVRIPKAVAFSFQFLGLDYSNSTRASFSQSVHPFFGRPDCSGSDSRSEDLIVSHGTGNQSDPFSVTLPGMGLWHVCISSEAGAAGSWWPQGEQVPDDTVYAYIDVFEEATPASVTAMDPPGFERGKVFEMTFQGVQVSPLTRVGFALRGECNTNIQSVTSVATEGPVKMTAPSWTSAVSSEIEMVFKLCYRQIGQSEYSEQKAPGVQFASMVGANRIVQYLRLQYLEADSREHVLGLTISAQHPFAFVMYGPAYSAHAAVGLSDVGKLPCTDLVALPAITRSGENVREANVPAAGTYMICYRIFSMANATNQSVNGPAMPTPVWLEQQGLIVNVIPAALPTSIAAVKCIGPPHKCLSFCDGNSTAVPSVRAQSGILLELIGAEYSYSTRIAFTASGDCRHRVLESPLLPDLTFEFLYEMPGMLQVCYSTNYDSITDATWHLQVNRGVGVLVETVWDDAALVEANGKYRIQTAAGGQSITVYGSGFDSTADSACHLSPGPGRTSQGSSPATVISVDKLKCSMPSFVGSSSLAHFSVRLGSASILHSQADAKIYVVPQVVGVSTLCGDKLGGDLISVYGFGFGGPTNWTVGDIETLEEPLVGCMHGSCNNSCIQECATLNCTDVALYSDCVWRCYQRDSPDFNVTYECQFESQVQKNPERPYIFKTTGLGPK